MLSWVLSLTGYNHVERTSLHNGPGPGRYILLPEELREAKVSLKSPEVVDALCKMSMLGEIQAVKRSLKKCVPNKRPSVFEPRHPVLKELLLKNKIKE